MPRAKVSARGQLVIPAEIRKRYGIEPGDNVEFLDFGDQIVMIPIKDAIKDAKGWLRSDQSVSQMLKEVREEERASEKKRMEQWNV
jgi:AbrB family looped-hinge helix DNA binding protein